MGFILQFLQNYLNTIIWIAGLLLLIVLIINYAKLVGHNSIIREAMNRKRVKTTFNKNTSEVEEQNVDEVITPDTIRGYETRFNTTVSWYNVWIQFIPVFPLLGILGTVANLILIGSPSSMDDSIGLALYSTLYGLIVTIVLKGFVAVAPSKIIQDTEIMLDDYDKKFDTSIKLKNISE